MISNRSILALTTLTAFAAIVGLFVSIASIDVNTSVAGEAVWYTFMQIAFYAGLVFLYRTGTFRRTPWSKWALLAVPAIGLGALFKILYWYGVTSYYLILGGYAIIVITYGIHFFRKPYKTRLDFLKLSYVTIACMLRCALFLHIITKEQGSIELFLFWVVFLENLREGSKRGTLFQDE